MTYVLVEHDKSGDGWMLHQESDGTVVAGPWSRDPRRSSSPGAGDTKKSEMYNAMSDTAARTSDYYYIRESSDTPIPWR